MKKPTVKRALWAGVLAGYFLLVGTLLLLAASPDFGHYEHVENDRSRGVFASLGDAVLAAVDNKTDFSAVLLPRGPLDGFLPGDLFLWEQMRVEYSQTDLSRDASGAFDGMQLFNSREIVSRHATREQFLSSGVPRKVFRLGDFLYLWSGNLEVTILDCRNPGAPEIYGKLPYRKILHVEMSGEKLFLLLDSAEITPRPVVVLDLGEPNKARELTRFTLPAGTDSFFFTPDRQLVASYGKRGYKNTQVINVYELDDDYRLSLLGTSQNNLLQPGYFVFQGLVLSPNIRQGLDVLDFSDPLHPRLVLSLPLPKIRSLSRLGARVAALGSDKRIYVLDFTDPLAPQLIGASSPGSNVAHLYDFDQHTYYFSGNGYLLVYDTPLKSSLFRQHVPSFIEGELLASQPGSGFVLLGETGVDSAYGIEHRYPQPAGMTVVDSLMWRDILVVLDDLGTIHFFRPDDGGDLITQQQLALPGPRRWLEASGQRLYVGGHGSFEVVKELDDGRFDTTGQVSLDGRESLDALAIGQQLYVAAGTAGVLGFSLQRPDHPEATAPLVIPQHLELQVAARSLTRTGRSDFLVAAGPAGLFRARPQVDGGLDLIASYHFDEPVHAVIATGGICLAATASAVRALDVRSQNSLQLLGSIAFAGIDRFVIGNSGDWAGHVPGRGWLPRPAPRFISAERQAELLAGKINAEQGYDHRDYRMRLFNRYESRAVSGLFRLPASDGGREHDQGRW